MYEALQPPGGDIVGHGEGERGRAVAAGCRRRRPEGKGAEVAPDARTALYVFRGHPAVAVTVGREVLRRGCGIVSVFRLQLGVSLDDGSRELIRLGKSIQRDNLLQLVAVVAQADDDRLATGNGHCCRLIADVGGGDLRRTLDGYGECPVDIRHAFRPLAGLQCGSHQHVARRVINDAVTIAGLALALSFQRPAAHPIGHRPRIGLQEDETVGKDCRTDVGHCQQSWLPVLSVYDFVVVDGLGVACRQVVVEFPFAVPGVVGDEVERSVVECHHGLRIGRQPCGPGHAQPPRLPLPGLGHAVGQFPLCAERRCRLLVGQLDVVAVCLALAEGSHREGDAATVQVSVI